MIAESQTINFQKPAEKAAGCRVTVRKSCEIPKTGEVATLLKRSSLNKTNEMNSKFKEQMLQNAAQMDASVSFQLNGDINVYPCPWEQDKQVTSGQRVRYRAGVEVDSDGRTRVKRVRDGQNGPRYVTLYETAHGEVKMTRPMYRRSGPQAGYRCIGAESVYVVFRFPKKLGVALTKALFAEEADEVMAFMKTRKEETLWEQ